MSYIKDDLKMMKSQARYFNVKYFEVKITNVC